MIKIQEIGGIKEFLILDESHFGENVVHEVKCMTDDNA
jgi:hypothetical protein